MARRLRLALLALTLGTGCAGQLQSITSGMVGCPPEDIEILDDNVGFATRNWTARCGGRIYFCSAVGRGASCAERQPGGRPQAVQARPPSAAPGCQYDTQCKGERVCRNGYCVDP